MYVPTEFEAEHLADARRTVILSSMRRDSSPPLRSGGSAGARRGREIALSLHLAALTIALFFTAVTGTWTAGVVVLVPVVVSLAVTVSVLTRLEARQPHHPRRGSA